MAPVTRRKSASAPIQNDGHEAKTKKTRKSPLSPFKSAIKRRPQPPVRTRRVTFQAEDDDKTVRAHLPTTPHPILHQTQSPPSAEPSAWTSIDWSKRKEQEALMKRAERVLRARNKKNARLPTPPQSPGGGRPSPFHGPEGNEKSAESAEQVLARLDASTEAAKSPREAGFVRPTSRHVDLVRDDIPGELELPATINNILVEPTADIKMEEVCTAFDFLKTQIQRHARKVYGYHAPAKDQALPSFTHLKVKHRELFQYIRYVADGDQYGWDKLIQTGNQRENLVYAIVSRALISYVFDAELFGASPEDHEELLEMCREYLHYDAFVRNGHRAEIISSILLDEAEKYSDSGEPPYAYFSAAIISLERRINLLLQPLRPAKSAASPLLPEVSLHSILQAALKVHLAIRLSGSNGTVYRLQHPHKLQPWDAMNMNCINQRKMDLTVHDGEEPLVKISCFPAVFATVPSGPNLEQFTDPDFVEDWKNTADPDQEDGEGKPLITEYPITLADVVLENTPMADRSGFVSLDQTMRREQLAMSDQAFLELTGINRKKIARINKMAKRTRKAMKGVSVGFATALAGWYLYRCKANIAPALDGLLKKIPAESLLGLVAATATATATTTSSKPTVTVTKPTIMTLTPETVVKGAAAANATPWAGYIRD
ncbi:hypothetical protein GJ744_006475 [Endocarpon pusillum]|uniref:Uncharacterized protein n=1 Tax=Endocarpon pusillum TaxID=364733 RepID=A0A8H7AVP9_9EURO|nr:hypothetical protein GJ744_006475 [Endocarpon pusillum]